MKKFLVSLLLIPSLALGSTVWTGFADGSIQSKATCSTGTESAPSGTSAGMKLDQSIGGKLQGYSVTVEANDGVTNLTAASTLKAYWYNPVSAAWDRANDLDLTITGSAVAQTFAAQFVANPVGRVAYIPNGVGTAVNVYIFASR